MDGMMEPSGYMPSRSVSDTLVQSHPQSIHLRILPHRRQYIQVHHSNHSHSLRYLRRLLRQRYPLVRGPARLVPQGARLLAEPFLGREPHEAMGGELAGGGMCVMCGEGYVWGVCLILYYR